MSVKAGVGGGTKRRKNIAPRQHRLNRQGRESILLAEIRNCSFSLHQHISNNAELPSAASEAALQKTMPQGIEAEAKCNKIISPHPEHL